MASTGNREGNHVYCEFCERFACDAGNPGMEYHECWLLDLSRSGKCGLDSHYLLEATAEKDRAPRQARGIISSLWPSRSKTCSAMRYFARASEKRGWWRARLKART